MYKVISIDEEKESLPGYSPQNADAFHSESAKNADKKFEQELKKIQNRNVILMCGGSASGKTEFIAKFCPTENDAPSKEISGIVFDSTLPTEEGAKVKIRKILKSRNVPRVYFILPYSLNRCFRAFHERERKIPEIRFFETHSGARKVALWIAKNHPEIKLAIYYNRLNEEAAESDGDSKIAVDEYGFGFVEIEFDNKNEMISFLEKEQCSVEEIKILINNGK